MKRRTPEPTPYETFLARRLAKRNAAARPEQQAAQTIPTAPCVIDVGDAFRCSCGREQPAPGVYAAAHWNERLERRCDGCGSTIFLTSGRVVVVPKLKRRRKGPST